MSEEDIFNNDGPVESGVVIAVGPEDDRVPCTIKHFKKFLEPIGYRIDS